MNSSENRSSESFRPSGKPSPEVSKLSERPLYPSSKPTSVPVPASEDPSLTERQEPIPPPSHPRQYRAIGLIRGQYRRSEEQMTRGTLVTLDGTEIEAVLLGRVISLVKNHLDLEQPHLWVVYPRTRQKDNHLHIQIVGVWEPETLSKDRFPTSEQSSEEISAKTESGYFSVRGEVVYYSQEKETIIVKIRQSPKRESEKPKFFKLKLQGTLGERAVGHFWDFQARLQADTLMVREAEDLGQLFRKKKPFSRKPRRDRFDRSERPERPDKRKFSSGDREIPRGRAPEGDKPSVGRPFLPKPTQKKDN
ncbi:MAG: hypothetical protein IGR93_05550 [Hydrococcus sp. C42_A2020_068]|nr:hypothetical protein [Hydrococcus sp. C42_A2020_068]